MKLDFIIIGAQKAGTTSLASYLRNSPAIYIPAEKELPFFANEDMYRRGVEWFFQEFFGKARDEQIKGTSTPQYLMYPHCFSRIKAAQPDVKLIAVLRDPIKRLISHYDMAVRLGLETHSLNAVIQEQLEQIDACRAAPYVQRTRSKYVTSGEYGLALQVARRHFSAEQILVLDFTSLTAKPQAIVDQISKFLGVPEFQAPNIRTVQMQGGKKKRIPFDHDKYLQLGARLARRYPWLALAPLRRIARRTSSWLDNHNVDPSSKSSVSEIRPEVLSRLRNHYAADRERLLSLGYRPGWTFD